MRIRAWGRRAGFVLAAAWIFGGMAFYFIRFSARFYYANRAAIDGLLQRLGGN